jgi:hypothetical protein
MDRRALTSFALRFSAVYVVLGALAVVCERPLDAAVAPLVKLGLGIGSDIDVRQVSSEGHRLTARVVVSRKKEGLRLPPIQASVTSNGDMMLVGPLLAVSAAAAWAHRSRRARALSVLFGTLLAALLSAHDAASGIAFGVKSKLGPLGPASAFYSFFLDSGGRQLLALGVAALAISVAEWLDARLRREEVRLTANAGSMSC